MKTPLNISYGCHKDTPILKNLGPVKFSNSSDSFRRWRRRSRRSPASAIFKNCSLKAFSGMEYIFRVENHWNELFLAWKEYYVKETCSEENTEKKLKKKLRKSLNIPKVSNIPQTSIKVFGYLWKNLSICLKVLYTY